MLQRTLKRSTKLVVVLLGTLSALAPLPTNSLGKKIRTYINVNAHYLAEQILLDALCGFIGIGN
jgi:hypothetical protein